MATLRNCAAASLFVAGGLALNAAALAQETITIAGFGGSFQTDLRKTLWQPAADAAGLDLREETHDGLAAVRVQVQSGSPTWDVVHVGAEDCAIGGKEGLFEPLDYRVISTEGFDARGFGEHWIANNTYSVMMAWRTDVYPEGRAPKNWQDFWNVRDFPGRRALSTYPQEMLEIALIADGVDKNALYPLDVDRAFASLNKIKPHVAVWWSSGAQSAQLLKDGEVDMMAIWSSRIAAVLDDGAPATFTYQDAILGYGCLAILKGSRHAASAQKLIAGAVSPEIQARIPEMMSYSGPVNARAFTVKAFSPETLRASNMSPENVKTQIFLNASWWRDNHQEVNEDYSLLRSN